MEHEVGRWDGLISRAAAIEYLMTNMGWHDDDGYEVEDSDEKRKVITDLVNGIPAVDAAPVVRCRICKHRPTDNRGTGEDCTNFAIEFPDGLCPCQCEEDGWYNWYPPDDWFCANGEQREITQ